MARTCEKCGYTDESDSENLNDACPGCGRFYKKMLPSALPEPREKNLVWWNHPTPGSAAIVSLIVLGFVAMYLTTSNNRPSSTQSQATYRPDCGRDIACLGSQQEFSANQACKIAIEGRLQYAHEWDGTFGQMFDSMRAINGTSILMVGSRLKAQNGFGAWKNMSYGCVYDVFSKKAVSVYAQ